MGTIAEKLSYLNTTKSKIRDSINLTGANLTSEDTFRSYASKLKKGYIDIINNGIDTLYNNFPKVSGIGSNLSLTPTYEAPMKLNEIQGDTLQDGTPTPDTPVEIQSVTGLQNIEVCGKNLITTYNYASSGYINYNYDNSKIGKTMTYSFIPNFSTTNATLYIRANTSISSYNVGTIATITSGTKVSVTFTLTDEQYNTIKNTTGGYIQVYKSGVSMDENSISNSMLEINNQATDYEPYKGNTYEVNLGKNLFSSEMELGTLNNSTGLPATETNCIRTKDYISVNPSTTYIISNNKGYQQIVYQYDSSYNLIVANTQNSSFTTTSTTKYIKLRTGVSNVENDLTSLWQLEKGSQATSYSPYFTPIELNKIGDYKDSIKKSNGKNLLDLSKCITGYIDANGSIATSDPSNLLTDYIKVQSDNNYTISLNTQFSNIGYALFDSNKTYISRQNNNNKTTITITIPNNVDYLRIWFNYNGTTTLTPTNILTYQPMINEGSTALPYEPYGKVWYLEKQIGKVVLTGATSENWAQNISQTQANTNYFSSNVIDNLLKSGKKNGVSNYFIVVNELWNTDIEGIQFSTSSSNIRLRINKTIASDLAAFKTWLSNNNTIVYYILSTPTTTEITNTELIEDLETLYTAKSQEGTTNISITSEDLEMILNVSALKGDA